MADPSQSPLLNLLHNVIAKIQSTGPAPSAAQQWQSLLQGKNFAAPTPNGQGLFAGGGSGQDPSYIKGKVDEYQRQQGLRQQQAQLTHQKKVLQQQKTAPPPVGGGAPPAQVNTGAPYMQMFHNLVNNLTQ